MSWIELQEDEHLRHWLRRTSIPMQVTLADGTILWCNEAFERLVDYTIVEIEQQNITWLDLTVSKKDVEADKKMAAKVVVGERQHYEFRKRYRNKSGDVVDVIIHVLRCPAAGEFECFLVSVVPLDKTTQKTLHKIDELHRIVTHMYENPTPRIAKSVADWAKEYPRMAAIVGLFLFTFLFGDRVLEIAQKIAELF